ncbi:hypothetical protein OPQ81_010994 [Rhizoctonia solani]|nr:hypothetical protein OPQ81_010994 [Rhizoctonia solani]
MDAPQADLASFGEGAPLIDLRPDTDDTTQPSPVVEEPTSPPRGNHPCQALPSPETPGCPFTPSRSIRELVEALGSPVHSNPTSPRVSTTPQTCSHSPSPFEDPTSFDQKPSMGCFKTSDTSFMPSLSPDQNPASEQSFRQDQTNASRNEFTTPSPAQSHHTIAPSWLTCPASPRTLSPIPYALSSTQSARRFYNMDTYRPYIRRTHSIPTVSRPLAQPWNGGIPEQDFTRPDRFSRTTAHTTISDLLFNFELDPAEVADLIDDVCYTARQVGVSTHDLLSRSVFLGTTDLGITPLCLEASRVDVEGGAIELVLWFMENTRPSEVYSEVLKGCLMRQNGMGEQSVWNVLRGFMPDVDRSSVAYDVQVDTLTVVPRGGEVEEDSNDATDDDEGSLYDDLSIIDAESEFLDQADIETLKSSNDQLDKDKETEAQVPPRAHRARIVLPTFKESLTGPSWAYTSPSQSNRFGMASSGGLGNKVLTAEWMIEGRLWALSIGEDSLILTLRQTSSVVSLDPVRVKAAVRLVPIGLPWTGIAEIDHIGSDRLLPTQIPSDELFSSPLYECEFDEKELVPGPVRVGVNSSVWKTDIRVSTLTLLELVGPDSGIKIEVVVRVSDRQISVASTSGYEDDGSDGASDWQFIDD